MELKLKVIGYWLDESSPKGGRYPDPKHFVDFDWLKDEREFLVNYLRADRSIWGSWDYSWCRFDCGISRSAMGSREYSDGVWLWPHGLPHYVECHGLILPDEFVDHARRNGWVCPPQSDLFVEELRKRRHAIDDEYWISWSQGLSNKHGLTG